MIDLTVPMLLAIGAVLSVLSLFFSDEKWLLPCGIAVWGIAFFLGILADFRKNRRRKDFLREMERRDRERNRFLSDVAHELKTPLTVIRGSAEALSDGAVPAGTEEEYYQRILRETDAMSRLVSDLLEVSRLRAGRIPFEPRDVNLGYLAQTVCESIGTIAAKHNIAVECDLRAELPVLRMDYDRIRQLTVIFLDNAVKHTPEGGRVTLFVDREGDTVILGVRDSGPGIAPQDLPYVFDRFYKADPEGKGLANGSGIGLSIARQIVLLHGGTVEVESQPGSGACFIAKIPLIEYKETV